MVDTPATCTPVPGNVSAKFVDEPLKAVVFMFAMSLATESRPVVKLSRALRPVPSVSMSAMVVKNWVVGGIHP